MARTKNTAKRNNTSMSRREAAGILADFGEKVAATLQTLRDQILELQEERNFIEGAWQNHDYDELLRVRAIDQHTYEALLAARNALSE